MRQAQSEATICKRPATKIGALLAAVGAALFMAAPAQAGGNEFDDGFQDQLGRLVATEVFHLGKWVLAGAPHYIEHVEYRHVERPRYRDHDDRHRGRGHYKHRWHHKHKRHHHERRHHYRHGHRHDEPCNVETHERVRRNRHGEVVEYERHERRYRDRYARRW